AGFYTGYIASAITLGRFLSAYPLGHVSDSIGRKPVIVGGLLSIVVFSVTFGLSTNFTFAILSRFILGLTNGISPALRTTLRETCGHEHVLQGMTYFSGCQAFSLVFGTAVGGLLAQPAVNYPRVFSDTGVFGTYPFLLPNLVGACLALALLPLVIIYVPETKDFETQRVEQALSTGNSTGTGRGSLEHQQPLDRNGGEALSQHFAGSPTFEMQDMDAREVTSRIHGGDGGGRELELIGEEGLGGGGARALLRTPHVKTVLFLGFAIQALLIGFEEAYPLWVLSTPDVGGLSWGTIEIGKVFLAAGLIVAMLQFFVFPGVVKVLGISIWQRIGCLMGIPAFLAASSAESLSWNDISLEVVSVASTACIYCCNAMVTLALVVASTSMVQANMRGKLGGLYYTTESLGRFIGPIGFANMFAWSISPSSFDWVDFRFVFLMSAIAMVVITILAWGTVTDE
ncbi:unnamed protein product, partial [Laminaria digitata]